MTQHISKKDMETGGEDDFLEHGHAASEQPLPVPIRIGERAPGFSARSTQGDIRLADIEGWILLFSHPADFTPVCTSEFIAIAKAADEFTARGCTLLGLSIDSLFSHLAWLRAIYDQTGIQVPFPLIEDPTLAIARAYGMVAANAQDASAVRATFFIDPDGIVRAVTYYPATIGRCVREMLRMLDALQRTDDGEVLAPEGWQPGDDLLKPVATTAKDVFAAKSAQAWYFGSVKDKA